MLSAAVAAREQTSEDNNSSDVSEGMRQGLAGDFTDSSESEFADGHSHTVAARATAPVSDANAAGTEGASEGVSAAGFLPPPRPIWGHQEETGLQQASVGQPSSRPAGGETHSRRHDRDLMEKLFQMLEQQDRIRREEDKQRRLQDEARRVQREREQRRLEEQ